MKWLTKERVNEEKRERERVGERERSEWLVFREKQCDLETSIDWISGQPWRLAVAWKEISAKKCIETKSIEYKMLQRNRPGLPFEFYFIQHLFTFG